MSLLPPKVSRLLIAAIIVECAVLGVIQIRKWIGADRRTSEASGVPPQALDAAGPGGSREGEPIARPSPATRASPAVAAPTRGQERVRERAQAAVPSGSKENGSGAAAADVLRQQPGDSAAPGDDPRNAGDIGRTMGTTRSGGTDSAEASGEAASVAARGVNANVSASEAPAGPQDGSSVPILAPAFPKPDEDSEKKPDAAGDDDADEGDSTADNTPPVLESLRFDPPQLEGGNVTTLTVQASDARTGLKSIWGEVRSPNRSALLGFGSANLNAGTSFTFPITLPPGAQNGTWYVAWISLTDGAANTNLIQAASAAAAPPGGSFTASSPDSDAAPPEVLQVWFDRAAVGPGEKNTISVEARDDQSGIASVMGACQSPSKSALVWFSGILDAGSGTWVGQVPIPKTADCGEWVVQQLAVKDRAGNTTLLQANAPLLQRAGFRVSAGSDCDFTSPTLDAFDLSPAAVLSETGGEIVINARVYDVGSGAATVSGTFEGPVPAGGRPPTISFTCARDPRDPDASWTGRIRVPQLAARGIWKVQSIRLEDRAKNARTYTSADSVVSGHVFQVQ